MRGARAPPSSCHRVRRPDRATGVAAADCTYTRLNGVFSKIFPFATGFIPQPPATATASNLCRAWSVLSK